MRNIPVSQKTHSPPVRDASMGKQIKIRRLFSKYKIKAKEIWSVCRYFNQAMAVLWITLPYSTRQFSPIGQIFQSTGTLFLSQGLYILSLQLSRNLNSASDLKILVFVFSSPYSFREETCFKNHFQVSFTSTPYGPHSRSFS